MFAHLAANMEETVSMILFGIGFTTLLLHKNLIKKIIGLNIMDTAVYLFLAAKGYIFGRQVPILNDGVMDASDCPHAVSYHPALQKVRLLRSG